MNMGTYGEASGQWGSCPAGFDKEAKTGSDRGLKTMLGLCVQERERGRDTVCVNVTKQKLIYIACMFTQSYSRTGYNLYFQSTHQRAVKVSAVLTDTCHFPCLCWLSAY